MKGKRILLVRVPEIEYNAKSVDLRNISIGGLTVPLGVTYLASVIRKNGHHDVAILDLYADHYKEFISQARIDPPGILKISRDALIKEISSYKPDIVGFSALFLFQHNLVKELAAIVKECFPSVRIWSGGYPTIIPQFVLKDIPSLDVVFIGEAESSMVEMLDAEGSGRRFDNIGGIAFRDGESIVFNKQLNLVNDLNTIPYPSFDMLPLDKYKAIFNRNEFPIITSRSCPFSCHFCSSHLYSGKGHRKRDIDNLLGEMEQLHHRYHIDYLWIRDDNFAINKSHAKGFLKKLIERKLSIPWCDTSGFHVNSIDEEFLDLCKASRCDEVIFAVESGSKRVLKEIMNKDVDFDHLKRMAAYCRKIDLPVQCYFVIGNPGETKAEIQETVDLAVEIGVDHCTFSIATPFPGTRYYDIAVQKGFLVHSSDYVLGMKYMEATMSTEDFSAQDLKDIQYDANIRVNFLENRLILGDVNSFKRALSKFTATFANYNFHAIARLMQGYLHIKLGDRAAGEEIFKDVLLLLKDSNIEKAYAKYIQWDTLPTNTFRQWLAQKK
jgi:anaerobic magnesium-protoporphyrin IX monomethyl ester cyclase